MRFEFVCKEISTFRRTVPVLQRDQKWFRALIYICLYYCFVLLHRFFVCIPFLHNIFGRTRFPFVRRSNKGDHNVYLGRYYAKVSTSKYFKSFLLERVIVRSVFGAWTSVICRYRFFFAYPCLYNKNVWRPIKNGIIFNALYYVQLSRKSLFRWNRLTL